MQDPNVRDDSSLIQQLIFWMLATSCFPVQNLSETRLCLRPQTESLLIWSVSIELVLVFKHFI
jgi:hypothetical protein